MSERDADVRAIPRAEGTKPAGDRPSPATRESMPLDRDGPESTGGVRGGHSHMPNEQADRPLDRGVGTEHLRSTSQGARPDDLRDATGPEAADGRGGPAGS